MATRPFEVHLCRLEHQNEHLSGEVRLEDLDLKLEDELIHIHQPLRYDLVVEKVGSGLLARGSLNLELDCECARCLKPFRIPLGLENWACHIPLDEDAEGRLEPVVTKGDAVDLTPYVWEDIVLALPQHPLCESKCSGLPSSVKGNESKQSVAQSSGQKKPDSIWDQLDKLKLS